MAVEDEVRLEFQGEDASLGNTTKKVIEQMDELNTSINNLISNFNILSETSGNAENKISNFVKTIQGIGQIDEKIDSISNSFKTSTESIQQTTTQMKEFDGTSDIVKNITEQIEYFTQAEQKANQETKEFNEQTKNLTKNTKNLQNALKPTLTLLGAVYKKLKDWTLEAAGAYGVQTRFNSLFDKTNGELKENQDWVDKWANALYLDSIEVENIASKFRLLTSTMGINNEKSKEMTQNMTQLAYDLSAVTNHQDDVKTTMNAINSALAGQTKALAKYGIALNQASLQETLNAAGIDRKVSSLNSAEKAELIYTQIMKQSAGMQGYYAKTLMSPANAANIVKTQFSMLAREIGNVFIPILMALVPIVIKLTSALRSLAQAIAGFLGINIDFNAYEDGFDLISGGISDIGDEADKTAGKVKNMLRDFDDLHVINFDTDTGSASGVGGGIGGGKSLFDKQEYADWSSALDGISDKFKEWIPLILAIGTAFASWKLTKLVESIKNFIKALDANPLVMFLFGIVEIVAGFSLMRSGIQDIINGNINLNSILKVVIGTLITFIGTLSVLRALSKWNIMDLGGLGLLELSKIAGGITLTILGLVVAIEALKVIMDAGREASALWLVVLGGISLSMIGLTIASAPLIAAVLGIATGIFYLIGLCVELKTRIQNLIDPSVEIVDAFDWMSDKMKKLGNTISGVTDNALGNYDDMTKGILHNLNLLDIDTELTTDNIDKYLTEDMRKSLGLSETDWEKYKTDILKNQSNLVLDTQNNAKNIQNEIEQIDTTLKDATDNSINNLDNGKTESLNIFEKIQKGIKDKMEEARKGVENAINKIKSLFNFQWKLPDIKMPHFGIDWDTNGIVGQAFQKLGFPGLPNLKVDWYETGGFPQKGDLFIANEREPELIGSMGNRSVVANNTQIIEGITQGSYNAFKQAFNEMRDSFGGDTLVYVGDTQLTDVITKKKSIQDRRFGR